MKVTIVETLVYIIDVVDANEQEAIAMAKETFESGDVPRNEMEEDSVEYKIYTDDDYYCPVADMTLDKDGNNLDILREEYK